MQVFQVRYKLISMPLIMAAMVSTATIVASEPDSLVDIRAQAAALALADVVDQQTSGLLSAQREGARFPGGKWVAKQSLQQLSKALRNMRGGVLGKVTRFLDDDAAADLARYSGRIADVLDETTWLLDLPERAIKETLWTAFTKMGMSGGSALQIADAIAVFVGALL